MKKAPAFAGAFVLLAFLVVVARFYGRRVKHDLAGFTPDEAGAFSTILDFLIFHTFTDSQRSGCPSYGATCANQCSIDQPSD